MLFVLVVYAGLVVVLPLAQGASGEDIAACGAKTSVGSDADAHVKLALWCEAHGLEAERIKQLALAVLIDPTHAAARGLMGLVAYRGHWQRPTAVAEKVKADEALAAAMAEYNGRRERTPNTANAQWKLALWCEEQGLKGEARRTSRRWFGSTRSRGRLEAAGMQGGRRTWVSEMQLAADRRRPRREKHADTHWKPLLTKWKGWLGDKSRRRADAEEALGTVTDPRRADGLGYLCHRRRVASGNSRFRSSARSTPRGRRALWRSWP